MTETMQPQATAGLHLYELAEEQLALDALVQMDEGEWTPEHEQLAQELTEKLVAKADGFAMYVRGVEALCGAIRAEEERLAARRKARENRVAALKRYALQALERMGRPKIEGTLFTLARQRGKDAVVVHVGPEQLPAEYVRTVPATITVDKTALYTALKAGVAVDGAELQPTFFLRVS
jgi:hypothetical protein